MASKLDIELHDELVIFIGNKYIKGNVSYQDLVTLVKEQYNLTITRTTVKNMLDSYKKLYPLLKQQIEIKKSVNRSDITNPLFQNIVLIEASEFLNGITIQELAIKNNKSEEAIIRDLKKHLPLIPGVDLKWVSEVQTKLKNNHSKAKRKIKIK